MFSNNPTGNIFLRKAFFNSVISTEISESSVCLLVVSNSTVTLMGFKTSQRISSELHALHSPTAWLAIRLYLLISVHKFTLFIKIFFSYGRRVYSDPSSFVLLCGFLLDNVKHANTSHQLLTGLEAELTCKFLLLLKPKPPFHLPLTAAAPCLPARTLPDSASLEKSQLSKSKMFTAMITCLVGPSIRTTQAFYKNRHCQQDPQHGIIATDCNCAICICVCVFFFPGNKHQYS